MESEQSQNFNERLSQWVANQGFWFQVRYSMSGSGAKGTVLFHLLRMSFRLLIFALLVAAGIWIYLAKRTEYKAFNLGLKDSLQSALTASEIQLGGFSRVQGQLEINRFACQGGSDTFFTSLEARNVRCKMGFLDGVLGQWDPGIISLSRLDIDLRAGADDTESAGLFAKALFKQSGEVLVNSLEVRSATLHWGYSERTRGAIEGSVMKIQRVGQGWRMNFKGGTFSQNWLRKLEIVNLEVSSDADGFVFEKAEFRRGQGTVDLTGLKVVGGERPAVSGTAKIRTLGLETALPVALRSFVEGSLSGDFRVSGSSNTSEGIGFEGLVVLDGLDTISLRKRFPLLEALSIVDYVRNYHRIDFREGSFYLKTGGGGLVLTDLNLKADDLFTLEGRLLVRMPTAEETKASVGKVTGASSAPLFTVEDEENENAAARAGEDDFTLKRAAQEAKRIKDGVQADATGTLFDRLGLSFEMRRLEEQASDRISKTLRYEGLFKITILPDAFERAPKLTAQFPIDTKSGRIPMVVPIEGTLYELTLKQAEDIYQLGTR